MATVETGAGIEARPTPPRVLVVDDEKNIRRTLELVLRGEGYDVVEARKRRRGARRSWRAPNAPVDLAIFDVKLPGMSGLEALERIRKDEATQASMPDHRHQRPRDGARRGRTPSSSGASDFFEKPLEPRARARQREERARARRKLRSRGGGSARSS